MPCASFVGQLVLPAACAAEAGGQRWASSVGSLPSVSYRPLAFYAGMPGAAAGLESASVKLRASLEVPLVIQYDRLVFEEAAHRLTSQWL